MKAVIALLLGVAYGIPQWQEEMTLGELDKIDPIQVFGEWSQAFERQYGSVEEEAHRYLVWLDNLYTIASYNSQDLTFKLRMNQFGDMTKEEFHEYNHGKSGSCARSMRDGGFHGIGLAEQIVSEPVNAPSSVDWSEKGVVTPVKNQGQCGSCWSFAATGALECEYAIKHGTLTSLSEQQLVDCAKSTYNCDGCNGGDTMGAFKYVHTEGGLCTESEYSYDARDGSCKASSCGTKHTQNTGEKYLSKDSATSLMDGVAEGCVAVYIEADQTAFQYYSSGVLTGNCGTRTDHAVLVVGYGTSGSQQYWKVKNSWGTSWGEKGYVLICKECGKNGSEGECGILTSPMVPEF